MSRPLVNLTVRAIIVVATILASAVWAWNEVKAILFGLLLGDWSHWEIVRREMGDKEERR